MCRQDHEGKNEALFTAIKKYESDVVLIQEVGVNWSICSKTNNWRSRVDEYLDPSQTRSRVSHNVHDDNKHNQQYGGTAVLSHGKASHYTMGSGSDPKNLGRWTWARYKGCDGYVLRIVSIYRPCNSKKGSKNSVVATEGTPSTAR